ncbi:MAG: Class SAM-dependent methyltransferase [Actinomycetota bacterium]|jgi:caffeoyl-CoA O-methyltransferase|nr:Class SAM-dependent methyltransferase [Actinomycetota bacterium]
MSIEPTVIGVELAEYIRAHASGRDETLRLVEDETDAMGPERIMQTAPEQAAFLELLVSLGPGRRAIEVGTFTGYGAIRIARGLAEDGTLLCCELDPERAAVARRNVDRAGIGGKVEIRVGPAIETIRSLSEEPAFDFAYVDAEKTGYPDYYEALLPRMNPGGLLTFDNVFMGGRILDAEPDEGTAAMQGLNEQILGDARVDSVMLGMADGLTLARVRG